MAKSSLMKRETASMSPSTAADSEDYELQPTSNASEPLLPRYELRSPHPTDSSPFQTQRTRQKRNRFKAAIGCLCLGLALVVPTTALAGCLYGRETLESVRALDQWDKIPEDWRAWLNKVVPPKGNEGAFPTQ